jgi:hypothetical protein
VAEEAFIVEHFPLGPSVRHFFNRAGFRLLKRMGWRKGEGIGEKKLRRRDDDDDFDDGQGVALAPKDTPV